MKRQVLPQDRVRKALSDFAIVELSVNRHATQARHYGVIGSPTFLVLDPAGAVVGARSGFIPAGEFIQFLQSASATPGTESG